MSNIDFGSLLNLYEGQLCDRTFYFELANGQTIRVVFFREQFCHLMGIQHIYENDRRYIGKSGFEKVKNGTLTAQRAKKYNRSGYDKIKERLLCLPEMPDLMLQGNLIKFDVDKTKPHSKIDADFVVYHEDKKHLLHLFLREEKDESEYYAPVSFVVKTMNDQQLRQFIDGQKYMKIINRIIEQK